MSNGSDRLQQLTEAGVSIWLDDLSRERLETGNLADLIKHSDVVGVTTNPSIFQAALADGERYDEQVRELAASGADVDARRPRDHHRRRPRRVPGDAAGLRRHRRRRRPGLDRGRPRAGPRHRGARSPRPPSSGRTVGEPNLFIKIPGTPEGWPAITRDPGRRHLRQRDPDLRARPVPPRHGGLRRRPRAGRRPTATTCRRSTRWRRSSSPASTPRSTSGSRRPPRAPAPTPTCAARPAWPTPGWRSRCSRSSSPAPAGRRWRPQGAPRQRPLWASHRRQEPRLRRHDVRRRPGRRGHRQHHAREDARGRRRPRRGPRRPGPPVLRRRRGPHGGARRGRDRLRRRDRGPDQGGRRQVRHRLGRDARDPRRTSLEAARA